MNGAEQLHTALLSITEHVPSFQQGFDKQGLSPGLKP